MNRSAISAAAYAALYLDNHAAAWDGDSFATFIPLPGVVAAIITRRDTNVTIFFRPDDIDTAVDITAAIIQEEPCTQTSTSTRPPTSTASASPRGAGAGTPTPQTRGSQPA